MANIAQTHHQHLIEVELKALRPTQMTVGYAEVDAKRKAWTSLKPKQRKSMLPTHWFPAVLGPGGAYYIVDHHHLGVALWHEGVREAYVMVLRDYAYLSPRAFWEVMEFHQWSHPYDERGERHEPQALPKSLDKLRDDPYRSLAGLVRAAGGYAKDTTPFAEFLWASYFRKTLGKRLVRTPSQALIERAVALARRPEARYLPGWTAVELATHS